jgi:hypothetical protein
VAPDPGLSTRLYGKELDKLIAQVVQIATLLGLTPEALASRLEEAVDRLTKECS